MPGRTTTALIPVSMVLALSAANAHHGWSDNTAAIEVTGTVVRNVSLAGPHASLQIRDADGQIWDVTLAPAPRTSRAGLSEDVLSEGDTVTIMGARNSDPDRHEVKTRRVTHDGTNYDVYPVN